MEQKFKKLTPEELAEARAKLTPEQLEKHEWLGDIQFGHIPEYWELKKANKAKEEGKNLNPDSSTQQSA